MSFADFVDTCAEAMRAITDILTTPVGWATDVMIRIADWFFPGWENTPEKMEDD